MRYAIPLKQTGGKTIQATKSLVIIHVDRSNLKIGRCIYQHTRLMMPREINKLYLRIGQTGIIYRRHCHRYPTKFPQFRDQHFAGLSLSSYFHAIIPFSATSLPF